MVANLVYIYYRKFFVKGDYLALSVILLLSFYGTYAIFNNYVEYKWFAFLFLLPMLQHHLSRKDLNLLQNYATFFKLLMVAEYLLSTLYVSFLFLFKLDFTLLTIYVTSCVAIAFLPQKTLRFQLPFNIIDPFWSITFRKYKLLFGVLSAILLMVLGYEYQNENLSLSGLGLVSFLATIPSFEREYKAYIVFSNNLANKYLQKQIVSNLLNFLMIFTPVLLLYLYFYPMQFIFLSYPFLFFILPFSGILTKYAFFDDTVTQSLVLMVIIIGSFYGFSLLLLPLLYIKSVKTIKKIQYAYH